MCTCDASHVMFTCDASHVMFTYVCMTDKESLFERSLQAELVKRPHLADRNPKNLDAKDEPGILFRGRLQGYFAANPRF